MFNVLMDDISYTTTRKYRELQQYIHLCYITSSYTTTRKYRELL